MNLQLVCKSMFGLKHTISILTTVTTTTATTISALLSPSTFVHIHMLTCLSLCLSISPRAGQRRATGPINGLSIKLYAIHTNNHYKSTYIYIYIVHADIHLSLSLYI